MKGILRIGLAAAAFGAVAVAHSAVIFNFYESLGPGTPNGPAPWARLTISQGANANTVDFVFENLFEQVGDPGPNSFRIENLWFNASSITGLSTMSASQEVDGITFGSGTRAGHGLWEISVNFNNQGNNLRPGEVATWSLFRAGGLDEEFFNLTFDTRPDRYAIAHVLSDAGGDSQHIVSYGRNPPSEIPGPAAVIPFALAGVASLRRRRRS